ncbi:MAG: enoyl-CoA hydratase/isomerase family protein [Nevskia sp.]|nr:enoyl-CoA hydratase/isomerase family protein [Nevskia sp.]
MPDSADSNRAPAPVLFREQAVAGGMKLGFAQLNAEKSLNALTLPMIRALDPQLRAWAADADIACVVLHGAGEKAFCAGGDVRSLRAAILAHAGPEPNPQAQAFFSEEYRLDHRIHSYPKPILLWGSGIVMGGGLGLMAGASHRVVTETSRIAMPEITLGLYPDVGASWFLQRMPRRSGLFLALTGASLNADDALAVGLADFFLQSADRDTLIERLSATEWDQAATANHAILSKLLRAFASAAADALPASNLRRHADTIERLTGGDSLAEVRTAITGYQGDDAWLKRAAAALAGGSPTSAALIWEIWQRAKHLSLADAFRMELIVSLACCAHPDFAEGVRALLVDKDGQPRWTPARPEQVSADWIAAHFESPWSPLLNEVHPLNDL